MLRHKSFTCVVGVFFCFQILIDYGNAQKESTNENLVLLFDRPKEPAFVPKGERQAAFSVPPSYVPEIYSKLYSSVVTRFSSQTKEVIPVKEVPIPSQMEDVILGLERDVLFSVFNSEHRNLAAKLNEIFMNQSTIEDLQSIAVYARDHVNQYLFNYALSVAILHRNDTQNLAVPSLIHSFPEKFVEGRILSKVAEMSYLVTSEVREPVEIPVDYTASDLDEEHRLAYFREDTGANLHHWHWHLIYPTNVPEGIVHQDRRGEQFYYMHQQIVARYNTERLCNKMKMVERLSDWTQPIKEGYFPKIIADRPWAGRSDNLRLQDVKKYVNDNNRVDVRKIDLDELIKWHYRISDAIDSGKIQHENGVEVDLDDFEGIDILGNIVESSSKTINSRYYGDLHNSGHILLAFIHDPDHRHLESFGVMADTATALRDPVFYRWHSYINSIFLQFKKSLPPYSEDQLGYPGVTVTSIQVQTQHGEPNELHTHWQKFAVDISDGLNGEPSGPALVVFTHLQNKEFTYTIKVTSTAARPGTVRIFLASTNDETGRPWQFEDQRTMFMELDRFRVNLKQGDNTILRQSTDSSVTIPFEAIYKKNSTVDSFCRCGWPQNLLIPKGNAEGYATQLFVMISNIKDDVVKQNNQDGNEQCKNAQSYCGSKNQLYPDARAMGYPFDRKLRPGVDTLEKFLTSNMQFQNVTIRHENKVL